MALNIAVPLTTVGDLMDGFGLLSPISPLSVDCLGVATAGNHGKKQLVSPVGSESSGVSSLDSDEIKKPASPPTTPTEEVERPTASSPLPPSSTIDSDTIIAAPEATENKSSGCSSTRSSLSSTDSISSDCNSSEESTPVDDLPEPQPTVPKEVKVVIGGRNVLNLMDNLTSPGHFRLQFAQLPENDNIHFFLDNRSQYHRLGANGHIQEYTMVNCKCCDFRYPVNGTSPTSGGVTTPIGQTNWATTVQQQHQTQLQQQQPFQWNSFNNYDSISSRSKLGLNVAASAFNKTFGGGNNNNNNNNNGSQYFRSNNATSLFGRDSNRSNSSGNFLNSSTSTYNNHKSYQQSFGTSNNSNNSSKFNTPYGNYQFQQQQQQHLLSKNQQMRFGSGNGNGSGGFNASAAVAAATAMAGQNMLNFNGNFNGKNNNNNNNNMFAYYKAMMN
ncbi:probable inactive serine/threonine-protein kinase scy2 isoform X2 [Ochlerotatus camptorhynchus]